MTSLSDHLVDKLRPYQGRRWWLAFSGGLDSTVLLHALAALDPRPQLLAIHVHHGLLAEADQWQRHCSDVCAALGIEFHCVRVTIAATASLENAARDARYQAFEQLLEAGDLLLQGHHLDDQVETLLLRVLRGTGLAGLQGIPEVRPLGAARLVRPLLDQPRSVLEAYARDHQLAWVEDPSNRENRFDRNFLRNQVLPLIAGRWPHYRQSLRRLSVLAAEAVAREQAQTADQPRLGRQPLALAELETLDAAQRRQHLRRWLAAWQLVPSHAQTQALVATVVEAAADAQPLLVLGGRQIRRYQGFLHVTELTRFDASGRWRWDGYAPLVLPGAGRLSARQAPGAPPMDFTVAFRQGGERFHPEGRAHSQQLKKLLQEAGVPPWRRPRLPLIYLDGELAAVADLWVSEPWSAALRGWQFCWLPEE